MGRRTRQIVAWTLGDRSQQSAADLRASLPEDYRRLATRNDLWAACRAAFPTCTHRCCTEAEGETCHMEHWFATFRARVSPLVRRACSFSMPPENPLDAIHFCITTYNLQSKQSTPK